MNTFDKLSDILINRLIDKFHFIFYYWLLVSTITKRKGFPKSIKKDHMHRKGCRSRSNDDINRRFHGSFPEFSVSYMPNMFSHSCVNSC
jgi:hypothetical protein